MYVRAIAKLAWDYHKPHPFTDREPLERQILRVLENKVGKVEYGSQPE